MPAAHCLLLAARDERLTRAIGKLGPEPAFAKKTLTLRLSKALDTKPLAPKPNGAVPISVRERQQPKPLSHAARATERASRAQLVALQALLG